jgi:hypothetical protein
MTTFYVAGGIIVAILAAYLALLLFFWLNGPRTVEYLMVPNPAGVSKGTPNVGCELYGKEIRRNGERAILFRFRADSESERYLVDCIKRSMPRGSRLERTSWFQAELHEWRSRS